MEDINTLWHEQERDYTDAGVHIRKDIDKNPALIATFDGEEQISDWKAALQLEEEKWFVDGYRTAKENL
jgi:hypothetical protein